MLGKRQQTVGLTGAAVSPVACASAVDLTVAGVGSIISLVGDGLEIVSNIASEDYGKASGNAIISIAGEVTSKLINAGIKKIAPMPPEIKLAQL